MPANVMSLVRETLDLYYIDSVTLVAGSYVMGLEVHRVTDASNLVFDKVDRHTLVETSGVVVAQT